MSLAIGIIIFLLVLFAFLIIAVGGIICKKRMQSQEEEISEVRHKGTLKVPNKKSKGRE